MEEIFKFLGMGLVAILGFGAYYYFTKKRKERVDELKKMPARDVVDSLPNADDVRGTIDRGRNRFADRVRDYLKSFKSKGDDPGDSENSGRGNSEDSGGSGKRSGDTADSGNRGKGGGDPDVEDGSAGSDSGGGGNPAVESPRLKYLYGRIKLHWTFRDWKITQFWGENPEWYKPYGLAGHNGLDFGIKAGTIVRAVADGKVLYAGNDPKGYGLYVVLDHGNCHTLYGHLKALWVKTGDEVKAKDNLGPSDTTGWCTGPHLHFGIRPMKKGKKRYPDNKYKGWVDPKGEEIEWIYESECA